MCYKWNMKPLLCAIGLLSGMMNLWAHQTNDDLSYVETKSVDGFSIGVTDYYGLTNTPTDRRLCFTVWTTNRIWHNNPTHVIIPTEPEYAYQVELLDTNGIAVAKTELGKTVGSKFMDFNLTPSISGIHTQMIGANRRGNASTLLIIFCPKDYFEITKPGNYTLRIRFQILAFQDTGPNRGDYTNVLTRFPPLNYPLFQQTNQINPRTK